MLGGNHVQALTLEMSKYGLYSEPWLTREIRREPSKGMFCNWKEIPEAIAVTLVVPPSRWKPFFQTASSKRMALGVEGHLRATNRWHNIYADVHITFGTLTASGIRANDAYAVQVEEDATGMLGDSPMIATFYASAAALQVDMDTSQVALCLQSTMQNMAIFSKKLGTTMAIFEAKLQDKKHVYITKHSPGHHGPPLVSLKACAEAQPSDTTLTPEVDASSGAIVAVNGRLNIVLEEGKRLLQEKVPITLEQTSPFTIDIIFGERALVRTLKYRVPVTEENSKTRIARKSSYVEVVAQLAEPGASGVLEDYIFPTVTDRDGSSTSVSTLNITHLNLDTLPIIDVADKDSIRFLNTLASFTFSVRERRLRHEAATVAAGTDDDAGLTPSARLNFKESLFTMFMLASGLQGGQTGLFAVSHPGRGGIHVLLFVSALRLDGAAGSVVLDCAAIPVTAAMLADDGEGGGGFRDFLLGLRALECCTLTVDDAELALWKRVLPALAERCRTWSHGEACEYTAAGGNVPVGLEPGGLVLCTCGRGGLPDDFVGVPGWEVAARYATRVAVSPTFAVGFVEELVDGALADAVRSQLSSGEGVTRAAEACRNCGKKQGKGGEALKKCAKCLGVRYCSAECQKKDWKKHRMECKETEAYGMG